jgi:hypothetical protein
LPCSTQPPGITSLSRITGVEVIAAWCRRARLGDIVATDVTALAQFRQDAAGVYRVIEVTPALVTRAVAFAETYASRGDDTVQRAAAVDIHTRGETLGLPVLAPVSADEDLNVAATAEGLAVENPNRH